MYSKSFMYILFKEFEKGNQASLLPLCNAMGMVATLTVMHGGWIIVHLQIWCDHSTQCAQIIVAADLLFDNLNTFMT